MKKVSEVAKELGVSPQSIYKRINNTFKQRLKEHVHKDEGGKTLIDTEGIEIIRESFKPTDCEPFQQPFNNRSQERLIEIMAKQLEEKDQQITNMMRQMEIMQMLLKNEQEKGRLLLEVKEKKEDGLFKRWFLNK